MLTPTRELAIQVAEAIHTYGKHLGPLRVLPVYGGQGMQLQLKRLRARRPRRRRHARPRSWITCAARR